VIIAASGMCTGGRVLHHLKHNLWKERTHVVITGFQARGSLGRRLVERQERVIVLGDWVFVRAEVHTLGGFSAHAGQGDLCSWAGTLAGSRPRVLLNHGEDVPRAALGERLSREHGLECDAPGYGEVVEF
jgi:metallo-beta-lactamase family protein